TARTGGRTTPQMLINDEVIGGYDALAVHNAQGILDAKLGVSSSRGILSLSPRNAHVTHSSLFTCTPRAVFSRPRQILSLSLTWPEVCPCVPMHAGGCGL